MLGSDQEKGHVKASLLRVLSGPPEKLPMTSQLVNLSRARANVRDRGPGGSAQSLWARSRPGGVDQNSAIRAPKLAPSQAFLSCCIRLTFSC